jgi:hypothetical protein
MDKYKGAYRISVEFDRRNLEPIKDDTFIVCAKLGQVYRVGNNKLAYYRPTRGNAEQFSEKLRKLGVEDVENRSSEGDILIYFNEGSLSIIASEVNASTTGVDIKPTSVKNLRKLDWFRKNKQYYVDNGYYKELSDEEKEIYRQRFASYINK